MKKTILFSLLAVFMGSLVFTGSKTFADELSGYDIALKVKNANKSTKRIVWSKLTVKEKGKVVEQRTLVLKTFRKDNKDKALFRFTSGLKRDVTMLSIEQEEGKDNIQYVYTPGVGRPRQIDSSEKQNNFEDTDFTNEDLGARKIEDYTYKRLGDETLKIGKQSFTCFVVVSENKNPNAKYPKYKTWIDQQSLVPVKIESYGKDGTMKKTGVSAAVKEVKPGIFMSYYVYAKDLETGHESIMTVTNVVMDPSDLSENLFEPANMSKPWKEK